MAAPGQSTFDGNPNLSPPITYPYRPGVDDFNALALADLPGDPPGDPSYPSAALFNTGDALDIVYGRMVPNAILSVRFSGGNPVFDSFTATPTAVATNPATSTFTIIRTPGGAGSGDIFIYWASTALPNPQLTRPLAVLNGATPGMIAADTFSNGGHTGIRIVAVNGSNVATDLPFTVSIM